MGVAVARWAFYGQAAYAALASALFGVFAVGTAQDMRTDGYSLLEGATVRGLTLTAVCFGVAAACFAYVGWHVGRGRIWDRVALGAEAPACLFVWFMAARLSLSNPGDLLVWSIAVALTAIAVVGLLNGHRRRSPAGP